MSESMDRGVRFGDTTLPSGTAVFPWVPVQGAECGVMTLEAIPSSPGATTEASFQVVDSEGNVYGLQDGLGADVTVTLVDSGGVPLPCLAFLFRAFRFALAQPTATSNILSWCIRG